MAKSKTSKRTKYRKKRSERKVIIEHINRYDKLSQLERNRLNDFKLLLNKRAISRNEFLVQEDKYLEAHNQLRIYQAQLDQIDSEISWQMKSMNLSQNYSEMKI